MALTNDQEIQPWDSDHTALVHVLWAAEREGLSLDTPDDLAQYIMTSKWMRAVRQHTIERNCVIAT